MSFLLPLYPQGLGTVEIECLASYISRLANAHHVTIYQLMEALRSHDERTKSEARVKKGLYTVRLNGYSRENESFVAALEEATGVHHLAGCTMLSLRYASASNGISSLKRSRAWCPACHMEWEKTGSEHYEKLIWQIDGIDRCPIHKIELEQQCRSCASAQGGNTLHKWSTTCRFCNESLISGRHEWIRRSEATPTEAAMSDLIAYTSANPHVVFRADATIVFRQRMIDLHGRKSLYQKLGESFKYPIDARKMQMRTMANAANFFGISLRDLLLDPSGVVTQLSLPEIGELPQGESYHRGVRRSVCKEVIAAMSRALASGPPFPTLTAIAGKFGCNAAYLFSCSPELTKRIAAARRRDVKMNRRAAERRALKMLSTTFLSYEGTMKSLHKAIALKTGAPINTIRRLHHHLKHF